MKTQNPDVSGFMRVVALLLDAELTLVERLHLEKAMDPRDQEVNIERLCQDAVGTDLERLFRGEPVRQWRVHQYRQYRVVHPDCRAGHEAVHLGHLHVEEDEIRGLRHNGVNGFGPRKGSADFEVVATEHVRHALDVDEYVVNHEDDFHEYVSKDLRPPVPTTAETKKVKR